MNWISSTQKGIRFEIDKIDLSEKNLKNFGWLFGAVFAVLAFLTKENQLAILVFLFLCLLFLAAARFRPRGLRIFYRSWMIFSVILSFFVLRLLLTILFFLVFVPIGFLKKLFGKNNLKQKNFSTQSFWKQKSQSENSNPERLF